MYHKARNFCLRVITKTPLEPMTRGLYGIIVPSRGNAYDKQTFKLMRETLKQDANCVDVGAYRGEILKQIVKICPEGKHFAFEPVPENYKFLTNKFKNAKVFNMAVSDKKGTITFHHVVGRAARSGIKRVAYPDKNQVVDKIKIKTDSLDNVIPRNTPIDFIKIDVEGAELGVLKGAKDIISKYKPLVVFEHKLDRAEVYNATPNDIYSLLSKLSMGITTMKKYMNQEEALTKNEFVESLMNDTDSYFLAYPI